MRILHTADWHLGRTLCGASFQADQEWWLAEGLPAILRDTKPDLLVVAGDIYDRAIPPAEATALLSDALDRVIRQLGIRVLLTSGNHDDGQRLAFASPLLEASALHIALNGGIGSAAENPPERRMSRREKGLLNRV